MSIGNRKKVFFEAQTPSIPPAPADGSMENISLGKKVKENVLSLLPFQEQDHYPGRSVCCTDECLER